MLNYIRFCETKNFLSLTVIYKLNYSGTSIATTALVDPQLSLLTSLTFLLMVSNSSNWLPAIT
jgi:hypothetical protein